MPHVFVDKLVMQARCPVCGGERILVDRSSEDVARPIATSRYECGAHLFADVRTIIASSPCRAGTQLAVKLMTIEAEGRAR